MTKILVLECDIYHINYYYQFFKGIVWSYTFFIISIFNIPDWAWNTSININNKHINKSVLNSQNVDILVSFHWPVYLLIFFKTKNIH